MMKYQLKKYPKYKPSGIEWIGEIPEHWVIKKTKYCFNYTTGFTPPTGRTEYYGGEHIWITIADMNQKYVYDSSTKLSDKAIEIFTPDITPKGALLFSFKLSVGKVAFAGMDVYTNEAILSIKPNNNNCLDFFYYTLKDQLLQNASENIYGAKLLNQERIKNASIILPPLYEQVAIANYLDDKTAKIDTLINKKRKLIELLKEERTAIINQAVTRGINPNVKMKPSGIDWLGDIPEHWEVKKLKYYFFLINEKSDAYIKKIGLENIESKKGNFIETDTEFKGQGTTFKKKDILFGKLRPYLAKVWLAEFDGHAVGDFYVFRATHEVKPEFAKYRILDPSFIEIANSSTYGSKMPRVSWDYISTLPIAFPPHEEQLQIVHHIETETRRIDETIAKIEKEIELLEEYRTALISEVVTGKIKVIDS